ncbi:MAG TPA: OmpA family protein [Rhodopila sp.]|nr:OmpA family protein [Rhodopila sp.]
MFLLADLAGCATPRMPPQIAYPPPTPGTLGMQADRLVADLSGVTPDVQVLYTRPIGKACGSGPLPVVRMFLPGQLLFATDSDQPLSNGGPILDHVASAVRRDTPGAQLTILGHTDAVGSDAYNLDLSRRRAAKVLRALVDRGIDPARLSAVAIGKRQPVASDATPEGRARNRRVEFLVSRCLAANLGLVQQTGGTGGLADVLRLDPAFRLALVGTVFLAAAAVPAAPAAALPITPPRQPAPAATAARPRAPSHYQPNMLSPEVQPNSLVPAVPY